MSDRRDDWIRAALERAPVPEESPTFFDDVWEAAQARERASARRWRRVSLALAVVAAAAISSAAVLAAAPAAATGIDLTGVCLAQIQGGVPAFVAGAVVSGPRQHGVSPHAKPPPGFHVDPSVWLTTTPGLVPNENPVLSFNSEYSGYALDRRACPATRQRLAFGHDGLGRPVQLGERGLQLVDRCLGPSHFAFRVHIATDRDGVPTAAQLVVANPKNGKRLVYIEWTPKRVDGWSAAACD